MSLFGTYDDQNIFAKILRGEAPAVKVWEDDVALAFMDLFPQAPGHTLVVPKRARARTFLDFPADELGPFMERVQRVARAVARGLVAEGVTIMQFNGAAGGQTVFYLHVHVIPRSAGAPLTGHGAARKADAADLQALAAKIAAAM